MDAYLDCLYGYVLEKFLKVRSSAKYRHLIDCREAAWEALLAKLPADQWDTLDDFCSAVNGVFAEEEWLLFQEAVALGKWMAR